VVSRAGEIHVSAGRRRVLRGWDKDQRSVARSGDGADLRDEGFVFRATARRGLATLVGGVGARLSLVGKAFQKDDRDERDQGHNAG